jgi:iron(III) transport system ATP-binding protein
MPEITVSSLNKAFGAERALQDVSFTVREREFLTLLGPSGCGKTTTLMSIAGFQRPDGGTIVCGGRTFFDGRTNVHLPAEERNLGIVFQSYALWPHMTVTDNVGFPLKVRKVDKAHAEPRIQEILELVEITPYRDRYPHELSGGQQQRVALARALVYSPAVLLLDEPFSNLDAKLRERARTWLKRLQHELGLTTIFVTHDQEEAMSMSDRILVMNRGVILQDGTPEEVYREPTSRFVAEFLGQCNILTARALSAAGDGTARVVLTSGGIELTLRGTDQRLGDLRLGDEIEIAVRPEAIEFETSPGEKSENVFAADVVSQTFLGDHYAYVLRAGNVELAATDGRRLGSRVLVHVPPEACRVVNATAVGASSHSVGTRDRSVVAT